jgi:hypothetical protein
MLLLVSCGQKEKENIVTSEKVIIEKIKSEVIPEQYVEDETLQIKLEADLTNLTKNSKFTIEKELVNNRHVDNLIDTVINFKYDKINIKSYKATSEEWIIEAKILNSEFDFSDAIKIGMDKTALEKILNKKVNSDIVKVGNFEQTSVFIFKFKNEILEEIEFEGYVD